MSFTMVYYHIPEDFDDAEQPNAFGIGKAVDEIKLSDIKRLFPIVGQYHFRFKHVSQKTTLWMDLNDDEAKAISFQGKIVIKATRISWESSAQPSQPVTHRPQPQPVPAPVQTKSATFNLFEFEPSPQKKLDQFDLLFPS